MFRLADLQQRVLHNLSDLRRSGRGAPPNCLVYGPPGAGKRTIAHALADTIGFGFLEVNVGDNPAFVRQRLFGDRTEAERATDLAAAPGECGTDESAVLYLSGLENTEPSLHQDVHRLVTGRRYVDALGRRWRLSDSTWLISALQTNTRNPTRVGLGHWLCTAFDQVIHVDACQDIESCWAVCRSIAAELGRNFEDEPDLPFLRVVRQTPARLHAVRRWITNACLSMTGTGVISLNAVQREMVRDIQAVLGQVPYRQRILDLPDFEKWAEQFGENKPLAFHIVRCIADRYYISGSEYFRGIDHIIRSFDIPKGALVTFCKWQAEGRSAPRVAHQMKNQAHWKIVDACEIDLRQTSTLPGTFDPAAEHLLIIADDFSGSGRTLARLFDGPQSPISSVLTSLPRARLFIGVIAGYRDALQRVIAKTSDYGDRVRLAVYRVFDEEDKCFSTESRILPDAQERSDFRCFCVDVARRCFAPLKGRHRLGYNGVGSLVVFSDTVPNSTLPVLWYDSSEWRPLFPASGLPGSGEENPGSDTGG